MGYIYGIGRPVLLISALSDIAFLRKTLRKNHRNYSRRKLQNLTLRKWKTFSSTLSLCKKHIWGQWPLVQVFEKRITELHVTFFFFLQFSSLNFQVLSQIFAFRVKISELRDKILIFKSKFLFDPNFIVSSQNSKFQAKFGYSSQNFMLLSLNFNFESKF